jgi:DNA polymerase-1
MGRREWHVGNLAKQIGVVDRRGRIRCRINQVGATSGRWTTKDPLNLQGIATGEKDIYNDRDCFAAEEGECLIVADFSQLEYRLLAHLSREPKLIRLFLEGWDLHSLTCYNINADVRRAVNEMFGEFTLEAGLWIAENRPHERKKSKTLNFEIIYGVGPYKLAEQLEIPLEEARGMIEGWFDGYHHVKEHQNEILHLAKKRGFIRTLGGRYRRPILSRLTHNCQPGCKYRSKKFPDRRCGIKGEEERTLLNAEVQGSAMDVCGTAMLKLSRERRLKAGGYRMLLPIHDEVVGKYPLGDHHEATALVKATMEDLYDRPLLVPLPVSAGCGPTWASAKV